MADHTLLWLTSWGAPRRVRDALGAETVLSRGATGYPALVTQVRGTNARGDSLILRATAAYDARGRLQTSTAVSPLGGADQSSSYTYDDKWDAVKTITAPGRGVVTIEYDSVSGNRLWEQVGGSTRRVYYDYMASGQAVGMLARVRYPHPTTGAAGGGGRDSVSYDASGNLQKTWTPLGYTTTFFKDAIGRDTLVETPIIPDAGDPVVYAGPMKQRTVYDTLGLVVRTEAIGPAVTFNRGHGLVGISSVGGDTVVVMNTYDVAGRVTAVSRFAKPDPANVDTLVSQFTFDRAGRKTSSQENDDPAEDFEYDHAGNLTTWITKRGNAVTTTYDALGRQTRRVVPSTHTLVQDVDCSDANMGICAMHFPIFAGRNTVPGDTAWFEYDAAGQMVRAQNGDAIVARTYYRGGALATDSLRIREYGSTSFQTHVYGIAYGYDAAGRMSWLEHPSNLAGPTSRDTYAYDATTGALSSVTSRTGHTFGFGYDLLGRMTSEVTPGTSSPVTINHQYDLDGRRTMYGADVLHYDSRGKVTHAEVAGTAGTSHFRSYYSGNGMLTATDWTNVADLSLNVEEMTQDALGHKTWDRTATFDGGMQPEHRYEYGSGSSRLVKTFNIPALHSTVYTNPNDLPLDTTFRAYDDAGNVGLGVSRGWRSKYRKQATVTYYGGDERVRVVDTQDWIAPTPIAVGQRRGSSIEYRYDALGRRVLVRTRRDDLCNAPINDQSQDCTGGIERFVYAGDNVLWEMRGPGADSVPANRLEDVSATPQEYGVVGYTHAGGIDKPLVLWKGTGATPAAVVAPRVNWRGSYSGGTYLVGSATTYPIVWPGYNTNAWHRAAPDPQEPTRNWMGSLIEGQVDASGQMYMRNRMYDPATGQFTQSDPIGIGGGLNLYGFANGDPVSYGDPYGLRAHEQDESEPEPGICDPDIEAKKGLMCPIRVVAERSKKARSRDCRREERASYNQTMDSIDREINELKYPVGLAGGAYTVYAVGGAVKIAEAHLVVDLMATWSVAKRAAWVVGPYYALRTGLWAGSRVGIPLVCTFSPEFYGY